MSHLLRALVAVSVLAVPGVALAECTKDTDCKGDRVCERGVCVAPADRAPPARPEYTPPPPPRAPPARPKYPPPPPPPTVQPPAARSPRQHLAPGTEGTWEARSRKN